MPLTLETIAALREECAVAMDILSSGRKLDSHDELELTKRAEAVFDDLPLPEQVENIECSIRYEEEHRADPVTGRGHPVGWAA